MINLVKVEEIVREYFNSAIIIDDELNLCKDNNKKNNQEPVDEEFTDTSLGLNNPYMNIQQEQTKSETSVTLEIDIDEIELNEYDNDPFKLYQELLNEGFVTVPWQYTSNQDVKQLDKILNNTKLLIIDWDLEPSEVNKSDMGKVSMQLIHSLISSQKGLKCAVIYTKEDSHSVLGKLEEKFDCKSIPSGLQENERIIFFQEKDNIKNKSLFGFILNKKISPKDIVKIISNGLASYKSIPLHLLESANLLYKNLNYAIPKFNAPFEKVFLTQMITSDLSDENITRFINNNLLSSVLETEEDIKEGKTNFLFEMKRANLINVLRDFDKGNIEKLMKTLNIISEKPSNKHLPLVMKKDDFIQDLISILKESSAFVEFCSKLDQVLKKHADINIVNERDNFNKLYHKTLLFILLLDDYINEGEKRFIESFKEQTLNFTNILKYKLSDNNSKINTGSIVKDGENYLLCITPSCDTYRPEEVGNKLKFIIGEKVIKPTSDNLKNNKNNCYFMPLPEENGLTHVKWNFYDTVTKSLKDLEDLNASHTLKKDYIQNIINRYIAYQSRAGIEEVFYKESNYIINFENLI